MDILFTSQSADRVVIGSIVKSDSGESVPSCGGVIVELIFILVFFEGTILWPKFALFAVGQATIFPFWVPDFLRSYGCGTPNGVLWTIFCLIQYYVIAYWVYKVLHQRNIKVWIVVFVLASILGFSTKTITTHLPVIIGKVYAISVFPNFWLFLAGSIIAEYKDKILPILTKSWYIFLILAEIVHLTHFDLVFGVYSFLNSIFLGFGLIGFAYSFPELHLPVDLSYGFYLYHMTAVNALIALGYVNRTWCIFVVVAFSIITSWISTKTLGNLSIRLKERIKE